MCGLRPSRNRSLGLWVLTRARVHGEEVAGEVVGVRGDGDGVGGAGREPVDERARRALAARGGHVARAFLPGNDTFSISFCPRLISKPSIYLKKSTVLPRIAFDSA